MRKLRLLLIYSIFLVFMGCTSDEHPLDQENELAEDTDRVKIPISCQDYHPLVLPQGLPDRVLYAAELGRLNASVFTGLAPNQFHEVYQKCIKPLIADDDSSER